MTRRRESAESRFTAFVEGLTSVIACERKSVEPMTAVTAPARVGAQHQSLLHFVGEAHRSNERVLAKVREMVLPAIERREPIHRLHGLG